MDDAGKILSLNSDTYIPEKGGLHPQKVVEHHYNCFDSILKKAIAQAKINFKEINLIAFSQGPGLGPCLRVGAAVARSLALKLKIPIVGVNHCIAHIEIARLLCEVEDPLTLYVSGGNTIISAYESKRYQIFGETLDLPVGNMLDMIAREIGIPHPGGPQIEKIALNGEKYIELPYVVKGMDLSFSGLFSATRRLLKKLTEKGNKMEKKDIIFSLQETAFAMLTEVCERAIAHSEKSKVLLTGGVAMNKRLQEMIASISKEQNSSFNVVPAHVAGDNGAMIAWTGILRYKAAGKFSIEQTKINPKWRMDSVTIPWREQTRETPAENETPIKKIYSDQFEDLKISGEIIRKGAEAILIKSTWKNRQVVYKFRKPKNYRIANIDGIIRSQRTLIESRIMLDLKKNNIPIPPMYEINPSKAYFVMKFISGKRLKDIINKSIQPQEIEEIFTEIGKIIANIHKLNYIHGDLTTSNILITKNKDLFMIDFGLSQYTNSVEDFAMDIHLFKQVLKSTHGDFYEMLYSQFIKGYLSNSSNESQAIITQIEKIEHRGRYIKKADRKQGKISK
jgi:bifunctional N6-L-threonylcarbamoyladenine synthase / protein kinase Bud32